MGNEVALAKPGFSGSFADMERLADAIARSNLFGMKTKEQALVLMAISQAEGRHPALAARDYDIISNRPAKKAEAMLRDFLEGGGKVQWHALTDELADATFSHPAGGSVRITWDPARAATAGLGSKDNWKKFPRQMLRSRAISEGVRTIYPMATSGMYEPGEVADMPPHAGPTLEGRFEPSPPHDEKLPLKGGMVETLRENGPSTGKTLRDVVARLVTEFGQAQSIGGLAEIEARGETQKVLARGPDSDAAKAVTKARDAARARLAVVAQEPASDGWPSTDEAEAVLGERMET